MRSVGEAIHCVRLDEIGGDGLDTGALDAAAYISGGKAGDGDYLGCSGAFRPDSERWTHFSACAKNHKRAFESGYYSLIAIRRAREKFFEFVFVASHLL
jgi:hypothetical protein